MLVYYNQITEGKPARVSMAISRAKQHLFQHQGYVQAYLIIGGVDISGVHLFSVSANGHSQRHQFVSDGSGSYIASSILERDFKTNMTVIYEFILCICYCSHCNL